MNDLNVALVVRLLDQVTAPAQKVRNAIRVIGRETKSFRSDFATAFKSDFGVENLSAAMERSEQRISRARGRLMGAGAMALTLAAPVVVAGNFEERMIDFAILAEISGDRVAELDRQLDGLRKTTGKSKGELLDGLSAYVGKGLGLDEALASLEATGTASVATKSLMDEMANSGFSIMDNMDVAPAQLKKAFDIMASSGKEGSFELSAMARKFPEITAGAKALKMEGLDGVASLSAALQVAMKAAGSEDQAATNLTNFMGKITAPDTVKKFKKMGVNIEKELAIALERGVDPLEHMLLVIERMTGGDAFKMGELFADKQVLDFLRAAIPNLKEYQRIRDKAANSDGILDKDAARVLEGFNAEAKRLKDSVTALLGPAGTLLPIVTELMSDTRGLVEGMNAWTQANPELTATIVKGAGALMVFGIGTRVISFGLALMSGGLLRTASLFFKFNKAGKNISLVGRAFRATRWSAGKLLRTTWALTKAVAAPARWGIKAIKWGALIPRVAWRTVAGMLSWSTLITKLVWSGRYFSKIAWGPIASAVGVLGNTKAGWGKFIKPIKWLSSALLLFPPIKWASVALAVGVFAWEVLGLKKLPWKDYIATGIDWAKWVFKFEWVDVLPKWSWALLLGPAGLLFVDWSEVLPDWDWAKIIKGSNPLQEEYQNSLKDAQSFGQPLPFQPASNSGQPTAKLDPALAASIAAAMARSSSSAVTPQDYTAAQPNVDVQSTFEGTSNVAVNVQIDMPIKITREQKLSNATTAREAGRRAGAETERAVRRGLDDAAIAD